MVPCATLLSSPGSSSRGLQPQPQWPPARRTGPCCCPCLLLSLSWRLFVWCLSVCLLFLFYFVSVVSFVCLFFADFVICFLLFCFLIYFLYSFIHFLLYCFFSVLLLFVFVLFVVIFFVFCLCFCELYMFNTHDHFRKMLSMIIKTAILVVIFLLHLRIVIISFFQYNYYYHPLSSIILFSIIYSSITITSLISLT